MKPNPIGFFRLGEKVPDVILPISCLSESKIILSFLGIIRS